MLKYLKLENVGPAAKMELELGSRLNILTGDNGLGKSFLLDVAWFDATNKWPREVNPRLTQGRMLLPKVKDLPSKIVFRGRSQFQSFEFERSMQQWVPEGENVHTLRSLILYPPNPALSIYLMADGSCAICDPYRNVNENALRDLLPTPFVFNPSEILDGLKSWTDGRLLSNGMILDWAGWQKEGGRPFELLKKVLSILSPDADHQIKPSQLTRIDLNDVRDMPTIEMPYDGKVAIVHASSGLVRIVTFAYLLVWTWVEHLRVAEILGKPPIQSMLFLIDEVEAHLHPSWQRKIVPALLEVVKALSEEMDVQLIVTTHSPLIMASLEPHFDAQKDAWFDLDLVGENGHRSVELTKRRFEPYGEAGTWLISEAFDQSSTRSIEGEQLLKEASALLNSKEPSIDDIKAMNQRLVDNLNPMDRYLFVWRGMWDKKGILL